MDQTIFSPMSTTLLIAQKGALMLHLVNKLGQACSDFFGLSSILDDQIKQRDVFHPSVFQKNHIRELIPYRFYSRETALFENETSMGFAFEMTPLLGADQNTEEELHHLIKALDYPGAALQCLLFADPFVAPFYQRWQKTCCQDNPAFEHMAKKKIDFYTQESLSNTPILPVPPRNFRSIFSYSLPKQKPLATTHRQLRSLKEKAKNVLNRISGHSLWEMTPLDLISLSNALLGIDRVIDLPPKTRWNPYQFLSEQIGTPGTLLAHPKGVFLDGKKQTCFKSYQATELPEAWNLSLGGELLGDFHDASYRMRSPFFLQYGIFFLPQRLEIADLKAKNALLRKQFALRGIFRKNPHLAREATEHEKAFQLIHTGEKFVRTRFVLGLFDLKSHFAASASIAENLFRKHGFTLEETHFFHLDDLFAALPMTWAERGRAAALKRTRVTKTTLTPEVAHFLPIMGEWKGNSQDGSGLILLGRRGQLASFDFFAASGNMNVAICGRSGKGKSFFMAAVIHSLLTKGGRVLMLDLGRSFENVCFLLGGQYLRFQRQSHLALNPFSLCKGSFGDDDDLEVSLNMLSSVITTMAMPLQAIDPVQESILEACVLKAWEERKQHATIDDVIRHLKIKSYLSDAMKANVEGLIERLQKYTTHGVYRHFFYGTNKVNLKSAFVVIETEELSNLPDLEAVIHQIFSFLIAEEVMLGKRTQPTLVCIDEAGIQLKKPSMEKSAESFARRLRKYEAALMIGTQGLGDFWTSSGAEAIFDNSDWLIMMGCDSKELQMIKEKKILDINPEIEAMLKTLKKENGRFGECFIYHKDTGFYALMQLRPNPFEALSFSPKAKDFSPVVALKEAGISILQAIEIAVQIKKKHLPLEATVQKIIARKQQGDSLEKILSFLRGPND